MRNIGENNAIHEQRKHGGGSIIGTTGQLHAKYM